MCVYHKFMQPVFREYAFELFPVFCYFKQHSSEYFVHMFFLICRDDFLINSVSEISG